MLSVWFHKSFGDDKAKKFHAGKFIEPTDPSLEVRTLEDRIRILEKEQQKDSQRLKVAEALKEAQASKLKAEHKRTAKMASEAETWETLAQESEAKLTEVTSQFEQSNKQAAKEFNKLPDKDKNTFVKAISQSTLDLSLKPYQDKHPKVL